MSRNYCGDDNYHGKPFAFIEVVQVNFFTSLFYTGFYITNLIISTKRSSLCTCCARKK